MSYLVSPRDAEKYSLFENNPVKEILRNIAVILATPLGSVPLYRDFGLDQSFLDKPAPVAEVMMVIPVREAIERWEPRAEFLELTVSDDPSNPGKLIPVVEVEINEES